MHTIKSDVLGIDLFENRFYYRALDLKPNPKINLAHTHNTFRPLLPLD